MPERDGLITTVQAVMSEDKMTIQLQFVRRNGLTSYINIAANGGPGFIRDVGQAIAGLGHSGEEPGSDSSESWLSSP